MLSVSPVARAGEEQLNTVRIRSGCRKWSQRYDRLRMRFNGIAALGIETGSEKEEESMQEL